MLAAELQRSVDGDVLWRNFDYEGVLVECISTASHAGTRNLVHLREICGLRQARQIGIAQVVHSDPTSLVTSATANHDRVVQRSTTGIHFEHKSVGSELFTTCSQAQSLDRLHARIV